MNRIWISFLTFAVVLSGSIARADKLDLTTQSALIEKLESLMPITPDDTTSKQNMILRLADLHSERARLLAMDNEGQGEETHRKEIQTDRKRAIELYDKGFKKADEKVKGVILLQTAHLNQMIGEEKKSKKLFDQIITDRKKYDADLVAQAFIEIGDYEMNHMNFEKALKNFKSAQKIPDAPRKGYTAYRIAWCKYHMGETKVAINQMVALLQNKEMFKKQDGSIDTSFQEESSRDLATFLSRKDANAKEIQMLSDLSPENARQGNLTYLATELDRTGHKKSALQVWALIGTQKESSEDKLEGQIKIARIQYDLNKKAQTIVELDKAAKMLKDADCKDEAQCESLKQQIRKIVTDWGKAEEREPSAELISAYKVYTSQFADIELNYWAAQAAAKRKQYADAFMFYKNSAELTAEIKDKSNKNGLDIAKIFEGSLLGAIEVAELSKNNDLRQQAYDQYLRMNPNGEKSLEVRYQIAHVMLDKGDNANAANSFYQIAMSGQKGSEDIKDKSADLALDTLVLLKDDDRLEKWSQEFAEHFPKRKKEFLAIQRKTILNRAANVINNSQSQSELQAQWEKLSKTDLSKATTQERISFHKNRSLIATKLKNLDAIIISSQALLKEKSISESDRREALQNLAWAYEMKFDFDNALKTQKKIQPAKGQEDDHLLKLGVLSELAHKNPTPYYTQYLSISNDRLKKQQVAFNLVRLANNKNSAFRKYRPILSGNTQLYLSAGLYAYDEKKSNSLRNDLLSQKRALGTFEGQLLSRSSSIEEISVQAAQLAHSRLKTSSQVALKRSVQERLSLIAKFEKTTQKAIAKQDWTLQFITLSVVGREYQRLAYDISRLPAPRGLTKAQRHQYNQLVQEQIIPYTDKSKQVYKKIDQLWDKKDDSTFADVMNLSTQKQSPGTKLAQAEVSTVTRVAHSLKYSTDDMAKKWQQRQKLSQQLTELRIKAEKNPFDSSYLQKMKEIEDQLGRGPMVAYLDARLTNLKTGGQN